MSDRARVPVHVGLELPVLPEDDRLSTVLAGHEPGYSYLSPDDVAALIAYLDPEE